MINSYFDPPKIDASIKLLSNLEERLFSITHLAGANRARKLSDFDIIIIGIPEDRNATINKGSATAPDAIRNQLFKLFKPFEQLKIADLGNLKLGETLKDSYAGLKFVVEEILKAEALPLVLGGSQDLTFPIYQAIEGSRETVNLAIIDSKFDFGSDDQIFDSTSYLNKIVFHESEKLFDVANIGYQTYYVPQSHLDLMSKMHFSTVRLGQARTDIAETEPTLREADFVSIDISAIKHSDAPAHEQASVHGFYGEEICQMAFYTGINDKQTCFGIFELNPEYDIKNRTAELAAQIIWHFIQGFYLRRNDFVTGRVKKLIVSLESHGQDIVFYKSKKSSRWWLEVPVTRQKNKKQIISCSKKDYKMAINQEIPERWWKTYHKIN